MSSLQYALSYLSWVWLAGLCMTCWLALRDARSQRQRPLRQRGEAPLRQRGEAPLRQRERRGCKLNIRPPLERIYQPTLRELRLIQLQRRREELGEILGKAQHRPRIW
jgi:hypothetical protein